MRAIMALLYGVRLTSTGAGPSVSGRQMSAASRIPSRMGIMTSRLSMTGNAVTLRFLEAGVWRVAGSYRGRTYETWVDAAIHDENDTRRIARLGHRRGGRRLRDRDRRGTNDLP